MRHFVFLLFVFLAAPVAAQQITFCKGKASFELEDGSRGCLLGVGPATFTRSVRRDDGQSRSSRSNAGMIIVAMTGSFSEDWSVRTPRARAVCRLFIDQLSAEAGPQAIRKIGVRLDWPGEALARLPIGNRRSVDGKMVRSQVSSLNRNCRAVKHL